jgi:magnesium-protoporphyrin IX monomethyl ester (oxidative) cyclase
MKNILLIDPSLTRPRDLDAEKLRIGVVPPLGLAYIAAVMEEEGYKVKIIDCVAEGIEKEPEYTQDGIKYGLSDETIKKIIEDYSPEVVGISCLFSNKSLDAHNTCRLVKECNPNIPTVMGGVHPTVTPKETLKDKNVDFVILGEAEYTFRDLVKALEQGTDFSKIDGLGYKIGSKIIIKPKTKFIENLDELPFPARHLLKMETYSRAQSPHSMDLKQVPYTTMLSSRGCIARCAFCCLKNISGRKFRARSAENVIREIKHLVDKYNIKEIHFEDDNLTLDKERALKIFEGIKKLGINFNIPSGSALYAMDEEIIEKMKESGAHTITFAVESGNQKVLSKLLHKPVVLSKVKPLVAKAKKVGLKVKGFFIIGYPGETKENILETIEFARKLKFDWSHFFIAFPHYGTEFRALCESKGYLRDDDFDKRKSFYLTPIETPEFTPEYLKKIQDEANLDLNFRNNPNLIDGNYDRAIEDFKSVIKLYPNLDFAHFYLGVAYEKKGLLEKSIKKWRKALNLNPNFNEAEAKLNEYNKETSYRNSMPK